MKIINIKNFGDYLVRIETVTARDKFIGLYRGQSDDKPLLPSIAREKPVKDTTPLEVEMLSELKRRTETLLVRDLKDNWDWLVFAQHFGMKTRLLDWTSNPLTALWFACVSEYKMDQDSYVFLFLAKSLHILNKEKDPDPFKKSRTKVLRPPQNNERVIAQSGWFTAHRYSTSSNRFVKLETNRDLKKYIVKFIIPKSEKQDILKKLNKFGINNQTMFPDFEGVCKQLNWEFE